MLNDLTLQINSIITKINKNNSYFFYRKKKNTLPITLTSNVSSPILENNGIESSHQTGDLIVHSIDPIDNKILFNIQGGTGLYKCTIRIDIIRSTNLLDKEIIIEFREEDVYIDGWDLIIKKDVNSVSSNLFIPLTNNKNYSIWIKCESSGGDITIGNIELTAQPMLEIQPLPFI